MSMSSVRRGIVLTISTTAMFGLGAPLLPGCEDAQRTTSLETTSTAQPTAPTSESSTPDVNESSSGTGEALADMARRDVEAFLKARAEAAERSTDEAGSTPLATRSAREIEWNDPVRRSLPGRDISMAVEIDDSSAGVSEPLLRPAEPTPTITEPAVADDGAADDAEENDGAAIDRDRLRELVIDLSRELYHEAAHANMPLRELLLIAATTLVSPDRALSPEAIPGLTAREREVLGRFQQFFVELGTKLDGASDADAIIMESLDALRRELSTEPRLELPTVALCTRVGGFSDYDTFPKYAFLAHTEQQAIVYIEIAGFVSDLNEQGEWATELSQQLVIYSDHDGIPVWREDWQSAVDLSRQKRTDFFLVQLITLPKALSVGRYHLKIRVRDESSKAEAERTITFEVVADPKLATSTQ